MKKHIVSGCLLAATLATIYAADMEGIYNSWLGYLAGVNASGHRTILLGAGAGGEAQDVARSEFLGAAAGAHSSNLVDCVGIGFGALVNSTNMRRVVAIGVGALAGMNSISNTTKINNHFYASTQDDELYIGVGGGRPPVIHYFNGDLTFPGARVFLEAQVTNANEAAYASHAGTAISADWAGFALRLGETTNEAYTYDSLKTIISNLTARIEALEAAAN